MLLATLLAYLRCLGNGFVYDDRLMIAENRYIGSGSFIWKSLTRDLWWFRGPAHLPRSAQYHPLQDIWLALNYALFGLNPLGWHVTIVALHLLVVALVFKVAERLTGQWQAALLAAMLFGVLPIHAEAAGWPAGIPHVLNAACQLAAFYLLIGSARGARSWALALVLYAGALASHESATVFPALVAAWAFWLGPHRIPEGADAPQAAAVQEDAAAAPLTVRAGRALTLAAPLMIEVALYMMVRKLVLGFVLADPGHLANPASIGQMLLTMPLALLIYLEILVVPWLAGPAHQMLLVASPASPEFYLPLVALATLGVGLQCAIRRHPHRRLYLFCAVWMGVTIAPVMDLKALPLQALIQDRYLYLTSAGWCVMVGDWTYDLARRRARESRVVWGAAAVVLVAYAAALWHVERYWHDNLTLFTTCVEKFPATAKWRYALARTLEQGGNIAAAERELEQARQVDPGDSDTLIELATLHVQLGEINQATQEATEGIRLDPHPLPREYVLLAKIYDAQDLREQAEAALRKADSLPEGALAAGVARAQMQMRHGDPRGAEVILRDIATRFPDQILPWMQLGVTLATQRRYDEALSAFDRALELAPNDSSLHLLDAGALHALGRDPEALQQCRRALAAAPEDPNVRALMTLIEHHRSWP